MAWPSKVLPFMGGKSASTPPERPDKDEEGSKGHGWFGSLWPGKSRPKEEHEPEAAPAQTVVVQESRLVKTRDCRSKRTGDWVVAEYSDKTEQPPNVGEGHTDGDGGSLNALDAALQYNDVVNRKNDQLMKKLADVKMNSSKKDIEISRLKAQLAGSSESGHLTTSHDPRTVLPDMSPTEVHRGINQIVDHQAIMRETQTENRMLRTKVADFEIRVKSISSTDIESQIGAKDTEIDELKEEIEQLKAVAGRFEQMKEHSRGQSKEVLELKVKLQQSEMTQEDAESLQRVVEDLEKENWQLRERLIALNENVELLEREKQQLQVEFGHLQVSTSRLGSLSAENTELRSTLGQLRKERDNALSLLEDEKAKALTFKLDFEEERSDRERAHSIIGELEKQIMHKSSRTTHELETLKTALASAEVLKSDYRKKLRENMASANAEIRRLREDLDGRTSQVKQFVKQTAQLKAQLEHATKNIGKLSEEMDKWRKKAKKAPKKHKRDPGGVESDLYAEIDALHAENDSLTQQMEAMKALNKTLQDMLQQAVRKTSTHADPNAHTLVMSPQEHQTNEQKVPSHDQQPAKQAAKDDEIRQHLHEQFQQPSPLPHPVDEETPAAGQGQWMLPQRASAPITANTDPPTQQRFPKSAPNTVQQSTKAKHGYQNLDVLTPGAGYSTNPKPQQSEQETERPYENLTYGKSAVVPGEQVVHGSKKPDKLPLKELMTYPTVTRDTTQGRAQVPRQTPTDHLSPQDQRSNYAATTPLGGSARFATDFETDPARRAVKSNVQIPLEHKQQQQQQQQARSPMPRALPPESSRPQAMAQPFENQLQRGIDEEISEVASDLTGDARVRQMTNVNAPFDPNLICPMCMKPFRIGEIQKFKKHVLHCKGSGDGHTKEDGMLVSKFDSCSNIQVLY